MKTQKLKKLFDRQLKRAGYTPTHEHRSEVIRLEAMIRSQNASIAALTQANRKLHEDKINKLCKAIRSVRMDKRKEEQFNPFTIDSARHPDAGDLVEMTAAPQPGYFELINRLDVNAIGRIIEDERIAGTSREYNYLVDAILEETRRLIDKIVIGEIGIEGSHR
jgi:hypothetical protein